MLCSLLLLHHDLPLPLSLFLQLSDLQVEYLIFVYHVAELHFQLLVLRCQLLVLVDSNSAVSLSLTCLRGLSIVVLVALAPGGSMQLALQLLVLGTQSIDDVLLLLIDLFELLELLIFFCHLCESLLLDSDCRGELGDAFLIKQLFCNKFIEASSFGSILY